MIELRCGPWQALLDGVELRELCLAGVEVVHHLYVAVRTTTWGTVVPDATGAAVHCRPDALVIETVAHAAQDEIDFSWTGRVHLGAGGEMVVEMAGRANNGFEYNRIGICLLHPWRSLAGGAYSGTGPEGDFSGRFDRFIVPQAVVGGQLRGVHPPAASLLINHPGGGATELTFDGDLFETEDQRNWTDASFKTYSTPLAAPRPRRIEPGEQLVQRVACRFRDLPRHVPRGGPVQITVGSANGRRLPDVGTCLPGSGRLCEDARRALAILSPAHLRLDLVAGADPIDRVLDDAATSCADHGATLELALHVGLDDAAWLEHVGAACTHLPLARLLLIARGSRSGSADEATPEELIDLARHLLPPELTLAAGSRHGFCELNRRRPPLSGIDALFWPITPQVHAFDDRSLLETTEVHAEQVQSARAFAPGRALAVGPITLLPPRDPGERELAATESADERQAELITAAFVVASLKHLAEAGADSLTYFEPAGWRGLVQRAGDPPLRAAVAQPAGFAFPALHPLADAASRRGRPLLDCHSDRPSEAVGLALSTAEGGTEILLANLRPRPTAISVRGLRAGAKLRRLDRRSATSAGARAAEFRSDAWEPLRTEALELQPYETSLVRVEGPA
jgi:hypothetical protein